MTTTIARFFQWLTLSGTPVKDGRNGRNGGYTPRHTQTGHVIPVAHDELDESISCANANRAGISLPMTFFIDDDPQPQMSGKQSSIEESPMGKSDLGDGWTSTVFNDEQQQR